MNFMFEWQEQYLTSERSERVREEREHKVHIFEPTCNVLWLLFIWRNQFNKSKRRESWRHWKIRHSQRWHTKNTPLRSRMKWRMESTSGLVPSKTLSSICSEKRTVFRELRGTCNVQGQISEHIFAPNRGYGVYYPLNFFATHGVLKIGEYSRIFSSFSWGIFGHVTCLDQSSERNCISSSKEPINPCPDWILLIPVSRNKLTRRVMHLVTKTFPGSKFSFIPIKTLYSTIYWPYNTYSGHIIHLIQRSHYSPQCRWKWLILTSPLRGSVNIHHYSPPLRWIIVNYYWY